jgi:nucleoside-diphosphate-sugar epimerase
MKTRPRALVTGGAGFIGSHLVALLLARGWQVRVLDNFTTGRRENLPASAPGLEIMSGDIRENPAVDQACVGVKVVFHLAALVSVVQSIKAPGLTEEINTQGTGRIFTAAARAGAHRVVFSSSCAVYGLPAGGAQHENMPASPQSPYAATKLAGENLAAHAAPGLSIVCLRYFNVYGPGQSAKSDYAAVIPRFIEAARHGRPPVIYGDGEQTRDFIFVGDVAQANLQAAEHGDSLLRPAVFNIGTGHAISVNTLWGQIARHFPAAPGPIYQPARSGEVRFSQADVNRARNVLSFTAGTNLTVGLGATIAAGRSVSP